MPEKNTDSDPRYEVIFYADENDKRPFEKWIESLKDIRAKGKVLAKIEHMSDGNFGDHKRYGGGVAEVRIHYGPGYRIYYGMDDETLIVLLCGGDKSSQTKNFKQAKAFWKDYLENVRETASS
jgi:putative addiction module killer protein